MSKRPYTENEILEVEWEDSSCHHGWRTNKVLDSDNEVEVCRTVGYFYKETKKAIRLSAAVDVQGNERSETWTVPKSCICKIRRLK